MVAERSGRRARTTARMLRPVRAWTRRATANAVNTMVRCASMLSLLLDQPTPTGLAMEACRDLHTGGQRPIRLPIRSEEHTSELQSRFDLVCRLLLEKKEERASTAHTRRTSSA